MLVEPSALGFELGGFGGQPVALGAHGQIAGRRLAEFVDLALKSVGTVSKSAQAIAVEIADYSKKSFENSTAALEKLFGVKSIEKAIELQTEYAKSAYEGFVAEATKIGEMYTAMAKESYKPFESLLAKAK